MSAPDRVLRSSKKDLAPAFAAGEASNALAAKPKTPTQPKEDQPHKFICCGKNVPGPETKEVKYAAFLYFLKYSRPVATLEGPCSGSCFQISKYDKDTMEYTHEYFLLRSGDGFFKVEKKESIEHTVGRWDNCEVMELDINCPDHGNEQLYFMKRGGG